VTARTDGPFQYYDELYPAAAGVTGDSIRASADQPGKDAATITALAHELGQDQKRTAEEIEGEIRTATAKAPAIVRDRAQQLGANGNYAVGLVRRFAGFVDDFDTTVNSLNTQYQQELGELRKLALGQPVDASTALFLGPMFGVRAPSTQIVGSDPLGSLLAPAKPPSFDAAAVGSQIYHALLPQYRQAQGTLDDDAQSIATMFQQGPTAANVLELIDGGMIPLSAATLYPGLRLTLDDMRKALALDPAFAVMPAVGSASFATWYAGLTPWQKQLASLKLMLGFDTSDFNPYKTIKSGAMPPWAAGQMCYADTPDGAAPFAVTPDGTYGYFGGGTIAGPGGAQWPIVMPYFQQGEHVYMADDGQARTDGGIEQLDGHDPGWSTIAEYRGQNQYGSISSGTKLATGFLIATGQDLETTQTDSSAVVIGPDGTPYAGNDVHEVPEAPPDKAYWDVTSKTMFPGEADKFVGPAALAVQAGQAVQAVHNEDSHASRQWYVAYQVNDDGRTRAIVHTYSATPTEDDKTYVGSFANAFPTGNGESTEIPYNTRYTDYDHAVLTAAPDKDVEYSGRGEPLDNAQTIHEKMNK
jgi:hypothetical protein